MKRLLYALVPVALLASVSFAYPALSPQVLAQATPALVAGPGGTAISSSPTAPAVVAQAPAYPGTPAPQPVTQQQAPPAQPAPAPAPAATEESTPPLVVDTTQLTQAATILEQAIPRAQLAADATDPQAQQDAIQQTITLLAGSSSVSSESGEALTTSAGVAALLGQALTARQAAEQQWLAALEQRDAQLYVAGPGGTIPPAATANIKLGTDGLRPEEQATLLVNRAVLQATDALRLIATPAAAVSYGDRERVGSSGTSAAADQMVQVVRHLQAALKIVQIAINR